MNIVVPIKLVPDLVEELTIDSSGAALDTAWLSFILNEFDEHAIEQALLLKERNGGQTIVVAPDFEKVDDALFGAAAKGADRLIKLVVDITNGLSNHALARLLTPILKELSPDLILTGVQAHNDLDGPLGPLLAEYLGMPYIGYVAGVKANDGKVTVRKEYPGGLIAEMDTTLPAVLGIQASDEPPRYVAFSKVRQAMKTATIEEKTVTDVDRSGALVVSRMFQPETGKRATMIEGNVEQVADRLVEIFREIGIL